MTASRLESGWARVDLKEHIPHRTQCNGPRQAHTYYVGPPGLHPLFTRWGLPQRAILINLKWPEAGRHKPSQFKLVVRESNLRMWLSSPESVVVPLGKGESSPASRGQLAPHVGAPQRKKAID